MACAPVTNAAPGPFTIPLGSGALTVNGFDFPLDSGYLDPSSSPDVWEFGHRYSVTWIRRSRNPAIGHAHNEGLDGRVAVVVGGRARHGRVTDPEP